MSTKDSKAYMTPVDKVPTEGEIRERWATDRPERWMFEDANGIPMGAGNISRYDKNGNLVGHQDHVGPPVQLSSEEFDPDSGDGVVCPAFLTIALDGSELSLDVDPEYAARITNAPTDIRQLLAIIDQLRAELSALNENA